MQTALFNEPSARLLDAQLRDGSSFAPFPSTPLMPGELYLWLLSAMPIKEWMAKRARIARQVCRIERKDPDGLTYLGTAFLVAPSIVMTNWHVVQYLLAGPLEPERLIFRFDSTMADPDGRIFKLHKKDWFLASNPARNAPEWGRKDLDYALLRLTGTPGMVQVSTGERRGCMAVPEAASLTVGQPLCIVQHPDGDSLQISAGCVKKKLKEKTRVTRVTYGIRTREGSSGSPCFDQNWKLVALHHAGTDESDVNEGIPINAIRDDLPAALRRELMGVHRATV